MKEKLLKVIKTNNSQQLRLLAQMAGYPAERR